jgi:ribonuclease HI
MKAVAYFDGGCRPTNPGHSGCGVVVKLGGEEHLFSRYLGWHTNNYAEYTGCILAIKFAHNLGATKLLLKTDSQLVEKQLMRAWKIRGDGMRSLHAEATRLLGELFPGAWAIEWLRRGLNEQADALCTAAINAGRNLNPWTPTAIKDKRPGLVHDPFNPLVSPPRIPSRRGSILRNR